MSNDFEVLFQKADAAGQAAAEAVVPVPMQIVQRANPFDDNSPVVKSYEPVLDGVCGFAWVNVKPGNCAFANFLKKEKGGHKSYYGGIDMSVRGYNQSMTRKEAYAEAFAEVIRATGIKAYAQSRMD